MNYIYDSKGFGSRLRIFRLAKTKRSMRELSEEMGDKNSVAMAEIGRSLLSVRSLAYLAEKYEINLHWLITGEGEMEILPVLAKARRGEVASHLVQPKVDLSMMVEVPILSTFLSLGQPVPQSRERVVDVALVYRSKVAHPRHTYALRAVGDSMAPAVPDGALLFVDTHEDAVKPYEQLHGRLVLVGMEEGVSVKWFEVAKNAWVIYAENKDCGFPIIRIPRQAPPPILGRVFAFYADI